MRGREGGRVRGREGGKKKRCLCMNTSTYSEDDVTPYIKALSVVYIIFTVHSCRFIYAYSN